MSTGNLVKKSMPSRQCCAIAYFCFHCLMIFRLNSNSVHKHPFSLLHLSLFTATRCSMAPPPPTMKSTSVLRLQINDKFAEHAHVFRRRGQPQHLSPQVDNTQREHAEASSRDLSRGGWLATSLETVSVDHQCANKL